MNNRNIKSAIKFIPLTFIVVVIVLFFNNTNALDNKTSTEQKAPQKNIVYPSFFSDKEPLSLTKLSGQKYVLSFFSTWCGYCMKEYADFEKIYNKIPIYGVLWQDDPENLRDLLSKTTNPFKNIGLDTNGAISAFFEIRAIPQTFVIDEKGRIIFHKMGYFDSTELLKFFE
jgi:cytochrome c biogenesis protein CcmG/thiol:disulfide interchange protein DsbE